MKQHSLRFLALVEQARREIKEITPQDLKKRLNSKKKLHLIDVREEVEWHTGHLPSAIHMSKGIIERDIEKTIPDIQAEIVVYCSGGFRCALVANNLQKMGYADVFSLKTGSQGWVDAGYELIK